MRKLLVGLLIAAAAFGSLLILRPSKTGKWPLDSRREISAVPETTAPLAPAQPAVQAPEPTAPRVAARPMVRVLDLEGNALSQVRIDRIPRPPDWRERLGTWPEDGGLDFRNATRASVTDAEGMAELPELDSALIWDGSLIWARAAGRQSGWLALPEFESERPEPRELRLRPSRDIEVTVVGMDGKSVAGAVVTERADLSDWHLLSEEERTLRQFEFLPSVTVETDGQGLAHLPAFPGRAWIQATADGQTTAPWAGIGAHHVTLRFLASCVVAGQVIDESGAEVPAQGVVSCQVRRGVDKSVVALVPVRAGGAFGPVRLPLASSDGFVLQYFGGELEAAQVILPAPDPDTRSKVEIRTRPGQGVDLRVTDYDGRPLANVSAAIQWSRNNAWTRIDRRTNSEGRVRLSNLPSGQVWVRLRKPGYVPELRDMFRTEEWVRYPLDVKMREAATVEGQCTSNGQPVRKFTVHFWQDLVSDGGKVEVEDSEDGSFRIEEAAPGLVQLLASSDYVVQSAPASLSVEAGAVGRVSIDFPSPRHAVGQIVDAASGAQVPTARLTALLVTGSQSIRPWKTTQHVDELGRFEFPGLGTTEGMLQVSAEGFANRDVSISPGNEPRIDLGRVGMYRAQSLVVRLHSGVPVDLGSYGLTLSCSGKFMPGVSFPSDGVLQLEDLAPGYAQLTLVASNATLDTRELRIRSGGNNTCDFYLDGLPLDVEVIPPSGSRLPEKWTLTVLYVDRVGQQLARTCPLGRSSEVHVGRIDANRVLLEVLADDGLCLAMEGFQLPESGPRRLTFEMNPRPLKIRAVDEGHHPIVGATVYLSGHSSAIEWSTFVNTNESGEALVPEVGNLDLRVGVSHVGHAPVPCAPISAADAVGGVVEIIMHPGIAAELLLRDGGDGLPGVQPELTDTCGTVMSLGQVQAGEDGRVRIPHLAPGDYRVVVDHPGIWRTEQPITVTATSTSFTVQLRRLGSARVRVRTGAGNPIEGASVELIDVATGVRVADWIQSGEVPAPSGGLRTDANGALVVHGVPRGSYRCVVNTSSGAMLERTLEVPPQATGELEAVIP